jgi:hypothetical protein
MSFSCHQVKRNSSAYLDNRLRTDQRTGVTAHLSQCETCAQFFEQLTLIRSVMNGLPSPTVPSRLRTSLRIMASRERAEVEATHGSRWATRLERWKLRLNEMMRLLAIPATGGVISSLVLVGFFILTIGTTTQIVNYEVPLSAVSPSEPNLVPVELGSHIVILNMSIDSSGRMGDYAFADPEGKFTADLRAHPTTINMPEMPTVFGLAQPISGDIEIKFLPIAFRP